MKFPSVAGSVIHVLMDFLGDSNNTSALDVIFFVREILETNPALRKSILEQLLETFTQIRSSRVCSCALWILGEFSVTVDEIERSLVSIQEALGPLPLVKEKKDEETNEDESQPFQKVPKKVTPISTRPAVLSDGTYATQTSVVEIEDVDDDTTATYFRGMLLSGDFFVGTVCSVALAKMGMRAHALPDVPLKQRNRFLGQALLIVTNILRLGGSTLVSQPIDLDNRDRMSLCVRVLVRPDSEMARIWLEKCHSSFISMLTAKQQQETDEAKSKDAQQIQQPDETIHFGQLKSKKGLSEPMGNPLEALMLGDGRGGDRSPNRILQLTGLSDPLYAEAYVTVHQYDIVLDISVLNRSDKVMQNLNIELSTMGDLKLVERPQNYTLAPGDQKVIRANIKVSSTETGIIFGNVVYESGGYSDSCTVILSDIHIDIMDYIQPATCQDTAFRSMWAEFEWENKVNVNTSMTDPAQFLEHIASSTNMKILTPSNALEGHCGYLAANLYAKSVFGEDALVNVSIEKTSDQKLGGCIRIRSKTQGIALSLGDKITMRQKH